MVKNQTHIHTLSIDELISELNLLKEQGQSGDLPVELYDYDENKTYYIHGLTKTDKATEINILIG